MMVTHLVLCTLHPELSSQDEQRLANALEHAVRAIPSIRRFTIGRRVRHGAGYETSAGSAEFVILFEFDDLAGLNAYLQHPAHQELGRHFRESLVDARAYDFHTAGIEMLPAWLKAR